MRAQRGGRVRCRAQDLQQRGLKKARFAREDLAAYGLAGQGAFHKNRQAPPTGKFRVLEVADAASVMGEPVKHKVKAVKAITHA